ncbi:MAG: hypothetical protein P4L51_21280 [Puia sp.]|nr:hypothetical protein [Puia sp.]
MLSLSVMEWEDANIKEGFRDSMAKYYPKKEIGEVMKQVEKWLAYLKKEGQ